MRFLRPGDDHNLLGNRSKGDPHPQYMAASFVGKGGVASGDMLIWDTATLKWVATSAVRYDTGTTTFTAPFIFCNFIELFGGQLIYGPANADKFKIMDATLTTTYFQVDTSSDIINLGVAQKIKRTAVSSTPYAVASSDYYLAVNTTAAITVTLPAANAAGGRVLIIKDAVGTGATTNNITITPAGADTCEVASITNDRDCVWLVSDGTSHWELVAKVP